MSRDFIISGESLVLVKGCVTSPIANLSQLLLSDGPIIVSSNNDYLDINVDAWGSAPADVQYKLGAVTITMNAVHFDQDVLEACISESQGGSGAFGTFTRAGTRLGAGQARFAAGNHYVGLNIASPVAGKPWRFLFAYLAANPYRWPLGTEREVVQLTWRAIPYTQDPWNGGFGAAGYVLMDRNLDT